MKEEEHYMDKKVHKRYNDHVTEQDSGCLLTHGCLWGAREFINDSLLGGGGKALAEWVS